MYYLEHQISGRVYSRHRTSGAAERALRAAQAAGIGAPLVVTNKGVPMVPAVDRVVRASAHVPASSGLTFDGEASYL